ncbi:unnamed protein product [Adineta steineri]|uniref:Uncharacterized protein n=1 Tax=Adineta steineri TaxID=433720 RepID=A0A819SNN2_9BILA|nr:unnamed protein product [Adineta steineri]
MPQTMTIANLYQPVQRHHRFRSIKKKESNGIIHITVKQANTTCPNNKTSLDCLNNLRSIPATNSKHQNKSKKTFIIDSSLESSKNGNASLDATKIYPQVTENKKEYNPLCNYSQKSDNCSSKTNNDQTISKDKIHLPKSAKDLNGTDQTRAEVR